MFDLRYMLLACTGCSAFVSPATPTQRLMVAQHAPVTLTCTKSSVAPIADTIVAVLGVVGAVAYADQHTVAMLAALGVAVEAGSALYGFQTTADCRALNLKVQGHYEQ